MKIIGDPKITGFEKLFPAEEQNRGWVRLGEETFQLEKVNCLYSTSVWNLKHSLNFSLIHKGNLGSSSNILGIHLRPSFSLLSDEGETQEMFALCKKWKENNVTALSAFEAVLTLTTLTFLSFMTPGENTLNNMLCFLAALLT